MYAATELDALVTQMSSRITSNKTTDNKIINGKVNQELENRREEESMAIFKSWIHNPVKPEKRMLQFNVAALLGNRASNSTSDIVKISNLFPLDVAEGIDFRL